MAPEMISLDPSQRSVWESALVTFKPKEKENISRSTTKDVSEDTPAVQAVAKQDIQAEQEPKIVQPEQPLNAPGPTPAAGTKGDSSTPSKGGEAVSSSSTNSDLPSLLDDETYSSSSYKAHIMGDHIVEQLASYRESDKKGPFFVGLQGPQGCGEWLSPARTS
jgi:hypothetical protein